MSYRTVLEEIVPEQTTWRYAGVLKDELGVAVAAADLTTLTLTLYNADDKAIINSLNGANILNAGRGVIDANGNLAITLQPADNPSVDATLSLEWHVMLIKSTWQGGAKAFNHEVWFRVANMSKVPP